MTAQPKPVVVAPEPPHNIEIEQALLGGLLIRAEGLDEIGDLLTADDFFAPLHGRIFAAIRAAQDKGERVIALKIKATFAADADMKELGGVHYIDRLVTESPSVRNARDFARAIKGCAVRRLLMGVAEEIAADARSSLLVDDPARMVEAAEARIAAIRTDAPSQNPVRSLLDAARVSIQHAENAFKTPSRAGVLTGIAPIDEAIGPMAPGDMLVLGGATSMGKTALAQQMAWGVATAGNPVLFSSLEMSAEEVAARYIAQQIRVSADRLESGRVDGTIIERGSDAAEAMAAVPLHIDDNARLTVAQIRSRARALRARIGRLGLIVIDHLRFVAPEDRRAPEIEQIQQITRDVKQMAKDMGVPVLLLAHLNRELWKRQSRRPMLSDLFGASAIEQNADKVLFVHREQYFLERDGCPDGGDTKAFADWNAAMEREKGKADLIVAKARRGRVCSARLGFEAELTRFYDLNENRQGEPGERLL